jgi:hypothetical protein
MFISTSIQPLGQSAKRQLSTLVLKRICTGIKLFNTGIQNCLSVQITKTMNNTPRTKQHLVAACTKMRQKTQPLKSPKNTFLGTGLICCVTLLKKKGRDFPARFYFEV